MMFPNAREGTIDEPLPCGGESPPFFSYLDCLGWCRQERDSFEIEWQDAVVWVPAGAVSATQPAMAVARTRRCRRSPWLRPKPRWAQKFRALAEKMLNDPKAAGAFRLTTQLICCGRCSTTADGT